MPPLLSAVSVGPGLALGALGAGAASATVEETLATGGCDGAELSPADPAVAVLVSAGPAAAVRFVGAVSAASCMATIACGSSTASASGVGALLAAVALLATVALEAAAAAELAPAAAVTLGGAEAWRMLPAGLASAPGAVAFAVWMGAGWLLAAMFRPCRMSAWVICSTTTVSLPLPMMPSLAAAAYERSMTRPRRKGPRSLTRTMTLRPLRSWVTRA